MKDPGKTGHNAMRILVYLIPIFAILGIYGGIIVITHETYPFTIVTGTSMRPTIMPGTVAVIDRVPFDQLKNGDVIVFVPQIALEFKCDVAPPSSSLTSETQVPCYVIHRIVSITTNSQGQRIVQTKGDNNPGSIPNIDTDINSSMYVGQVVLQFPLLGYATVAPWNERLALLILAALIAQLYFDRRHSKKVTSLGENSDAEPGNPDGSSPAPL